MPTVYVVTENGATAAMERVRCKDEKRELQDILERNYDLLPGDQIDPENPCRWMLIRREMPVPDPSSGGNRWSIDFLFIDQNAMPTFVECKRFNDTRSRREVVGQVLEYAANGQYYWSKEELRNYAEASAKGNNSSIDEAFRSLYSDSQSIDTLFERVSENLKEGQLRIVFFLEEAPNELKSLVDFLNKQMISSEVLLVEARQYKCDGVKVVVPTLFGFTEQARKVKRTVIVGPRDPEADTPWSGLWYYNVGQSESRAWGDMRRYNFIAAGGGKYYSDFLKKLNPDDRICAYQKQYGYVGFGIVTTPSVPVRDFVVNGKSILTQPLECSGLGHDSDSLELCEYLVGIDWLKTVPITEAKTFPGVFANQNVVCKLRDAATIEFLKERFPLESERKPEPLQ